MKSTVTSVIVTACMLAAGVPVGTVLAGSNGEAVHPQHNTTTESPFEGDHEGKGAEEGLSSKETDTRKNIMSPQKKPRLKYRDESKCSC